jgi:hypothetical protein
MAAPKTTINDILGIMNAVNKWAYSSHNIATVALKRVNQLFFQYFCINTLVFEKTHADDVVCSSLGLNDKTEYQYHPSRRSLINLILEAEACRKLVGYRKNKYFSRFFHYTLIPYR